MSDLEKVFAVGAVPNESKFRLFRKKTLTRAARIEGPFVVHTPEGTMRCEDGFLCIDARGYPYPVAADEFALIYEPATEVA